ncbi:MAG: UDP-N-acetylmuramoyl-L-alanyl-D-glutamate--2,6-diaminopimelate ligase [Elusimicrobia bacterium RIFCSPLOWO2_01_FULL_59_12]|nr:MAG: UDP-N-acetylmuramoyl-L-alanyl-D-glutamate--2,6-diaminopimelate ligase [Elusimicrobia bacterium RIFCSPLOWO2_01_FULL_59_12]
MKTLTSLLDGFFAQVFGPVDIPITDIVFDSRKATAGSLFVALKGVHQDGLRFAADAVKAGAVAVVSEKPLEHPHVTQVVVPDALKALADLALRFWDAPSRKLLTVGITGTNGKTTVCYLVESILAAAGIAPAVLGTVNYRYGNQVFPAPNTTPFSSDLQRFMAQALAAGSTACVMEVSSHALSLGRVEGVDFDVAVFTNLTQDHLDFHKNAEAYGDAKMRLFKMLDPATSKRHPRCAVLNMEDPWAARMQAACRVPTLGYALKSKADVTAARVECDASGSRFELQIRGRPPLPVRLALLGEFNVTNALAAAGVASSQGVADSALVKGLESVKGVPGRMERVDAGQPFTVLVDYAHTEDALRNVLTALRRLQPKRMVTVFGCGGDRDRIKRPLMGEAAARLSDEIFLTSDNPRSEDPSRIAMDVEVGIRRVRSDHYQIVLERQAAIEQALAQARAGDIVLIAGKGHETHQILPDRTIPFDDRQVARRLLTASFSKR